MRMSYSSLQNKHDDLKNTYDLLVSSSTRSSSEKAREIKNLLNSSTNLEQICTQKKIN